MVYFAIFMEKFDYSETKIQSAIFFKINNYNEIMQNKPKT